MAMSKRVDVLETFHDFCPWPGLPWASFCRAPGEEVSRHFRAGKQEESSPLLPVSRGRASAIKFHMAAELVS
jgi:hypothetical protein